MKNKPELEKEIEDKVRPFIKDVTDRAVEYMVQINKKYGVKVTKIDKAINLAWADVLIETRKNARKEYQRDWIKQDKNKKADRTEQAELDELPIIDTTTGTEFDDNKDIDNLIRGEQYGL